MNDFFDDLIGWFLTHPAHTKTLGHLLFYAGAGTTLLGLIGNVARTAVSAAKSLAQPSNNPLPALADIYPQLPTAWIPEHILTGSLALFMAAIGVWLIQLARKIERFY